LMDGPEQAAAYARADFEESHRRIVESFDVHFPGVRLTGDILDLGCGPGDITFRFAARFPDSSVLGVDGASAMIELANTRKARQTELSERVSFLEGLIPGAPIPNQWYAAIVSNSLLHHLHRPEALWQTVSRHASPGTKVFISDLFRPVSPQEARRIVGQYAAGEAEIMRRDFYNSLLAAFEPSEIETQIADAGFDELRVERISDQHLVIVGEKV
jgi:ubiquinone/menaquinone biosynthesis C-methylase UbiE